MRIFLGTDHAGYKLKEKIKNHLAKNNIPFLMESIAKILHGTTEGKPVHWSFFTKKFIDSGQWTNEELVKAMNNLLVPLGNIRSSNHNFWLVAPKT